ncbi:EKC/KEOPS complex subunit BUD32 [Abortiporus biennis]
MDTQAIASFPDGIHATHSKIQIPDHVKKKIAQIRGLKVAYEVLKARMSPSQRLILEDLFHIFERDVQILENTPSFEKKKGISQLLSNVIRQRKFNANLTKTITKFLLRVDETQEVYLRASQNLNIENPVEPTADNIDENPVEPSANNLNETSVGPSADKTSQCSAESVHDNININPPDLSSSSPIPDDHTSLLGDDTFEVILTALAFNVSSGDTVEHAVGYACNHHLVGLDMIESEYREAWRSDQTYAYSHDHDSIVLPNRCAICRTPRCQQQLFVWRDYYICATDVQPNCNAFKEEVKNLLTERYLKSLDKRSLSDVCGHIDFFMNLHHVIITNDNNHAKQIIEAHKDDKDFCQYVLDTIQEILDIQLAQGLVDWTKSNRIRARLCRLLGTLASECRLISLPSGFMITGLVRVHNMGQNAGSCGIVSFASRGIGGDIVAVKEAKINLAYGSQTTQSKQVMMLLYELMLWRNLSHPFIVKLLGVTTLEGSEGYSLVLQYFSHRSFVTYLSELESKPFVRDVYEGHVRRWMLDITEGMLYLHSQGYVHGDVRGDNILIGENMHAALTDFGLAVYADGLPQQQNSFRAGNEYFLPPERQGPGFKQAVRQTREGDVFSFACACLQLYAGRPHPYYMVWTAEHEENFFRQSGQKSGRKINKNIFEINVPHAMKILEKDGHPPRPILFGSKSDFGEEMDDDLYSVYVTLRR